MRRAPSALSRSRRACAIIGQEPVARALSCVPPVQSAFPRSRLDDPEPLPGPPRRRAYVPLTRQFGRGLLEYLRVVREDIGDVETIATELVANVVRHAQSSEGRFQALLEYYADRVVITVLDAGEGFAFRDVPKVGSPRPEAGAASGSAASACRCWTRSRTAWSSPERTRTGPRCARRSACATRRRATPTMRVTWTGRAEERSSSARPDACTRAMDRP